MTRTKHWKITLIVLCAVLVLSLATVGLFAIVQDQAVAAETATLTLFADEGGSATVNGKTAQGGGASVEESVEQNSAVQLTAQPTEGYVFAYWYLTDENTPLSYEATYSYTMPTESTTLHARFFKNDGDKITTTAEGWTVDGEAGTYTIKSADSYNFTSKQDIPICFEFVGEKWFTFDYKFSVTTEGYYYGNLSVLVDGVKYLDTSFSGPEVQTNLIFRTIKNKYHRVEIIFQTPMDSRSGSTSSAIPTALEFTLSKVALKNESEYQTTQASVKWDERLGDAYYLPGILSTLAKQADFIIENGIKLENVDGGAYATVPVGLPVAFAVKPHEQINSTLVPEQMTGVHSGGTHNVHALSGGNSTLVKFDADGKIAEPDKDAYSEGSIRFILQEIAIPPKVSITKSVDSVAQDEETISNKSRVEFPYGKKNNLLVTIDHYDSVTNTITITSNGKDVASETLTGKTGFSLNDITENQAVVITYSYGEEYYVEEQFTFNVYIKLDGGNDGLDSIVSPISKEITVTNDQQYPWYFDPAGNGDGSFAFSSGISYQPNRTLAAPVISQLGFTVKGNGSFTFEFHIDGYGITGADTDDTKAKYSYAAYRMDSPIPTDTSYTSGWRANDEKYTNADWGVKGFKSSIATNLGWGLSTSASNLIAPKTFNAEQVDEKNYWYKVTISITGKGDNDDTSIYIAHAIGNKANSSYACMSVRNVAFFSGSAYVDWDVQNTAGESGNKSDITVKQGGVDAHNGPIDAGTRLTFAAYPQATDSFYGWKAVSGTLKESAAQKAESPETVQDGDIEWDYDNARFVSYDQEYNYTVGTGYTKIIAVIDKAGTYVVRNGGKFYAPADINNALNDADNGSDKDVIVVDNVDLETAITVPAGVNLIIPFNRAGDYYAMGTEATAQERVSWASDGIYKDPVYTVTLTGANIIEGNLIVGGVIHYPSPVGAQGHTSGYYSKLVLQGEDTTVTVGSGGHLDVYGRVTGEGSIDVQSGGRLTQPFMINDYNGGTNTEASFTAGVTPFKMYAMVNVQNKGGFTIHHGAELWGHASLFFWDSITTIDTPFISFVKENKEGMDYFENAALIILNFNASAHIVYDDEHARPDMGSGNNVQDVGKTTIEISGNAYAGYMQFPLGINTQKVYFSIPYNYDITLKSGAFDILYPYKAMPGSVLTVDSGATLNVRGGAGLHIYDSFADPQVAKRTYPTGDQLKNAGTGPEQSYKPYASLIVNGTLNIQDGATFLGTVQTTDTTGTAKIIVGTGVTLQDSALFDGVSTEYSCNYTKYTLEAHIWDKVHNTLAPLKEGKTYVSTYKAGDGDTFTLPGIEFQKETVTGKHESGKHSLQGETTAAAEGLSGAWKLEHSQHTLDWTRQDGDGTPGGSTVAHATRYCSELGCGYSETKDIFDIPESIGSLVYKGANFTAEELVGLFEKYFSGIENATVSASVDSVQNVGNYTVTITLENGYFLDNGVYTDTHRFNWSVTAKPITVTLKKQTPVVYDGNTVTNDKLDQTAFDAPDLCAGDHLDLTIQFASGQQPRDVGKYNLEIVNYQGGNKNTNYTITPVVGTDAYEITARPITVELQSITRDYNGAVPQASAIQANLASGSTLGTGDELSTLITISITDAAKDVGTYTVTATATAAARNYKITVTDGSYQIDKKAVTVTADNLSSVYGEQPKALTFKVDGVVDGEETEFRTHIAISCEQDLSAQTEVGEYTITVQLADAEPQNYKVSFVNGKYNVTNAAFKDLEFNNDTVTYDGETHEIKVTGAPEGAVITYTVQDQAFSGARDVGSYEITATISHDNYDQETRTATLTINPRAITVNLPSTSRAYNGAVPQATELTATLAEGSTLGKGDNLNDLVTLSIDNASKNVGTYAVKGAATQSASNYTIQFGADGQYEITQLQLTVKIKPQTKVYDGLAGTLQQGLWEKTDGEWVGSERPEITLELEQKSNNVRVDSYNIKGVCADGNYDITFTDGTGAYTITKRPLTVTAHNLSSVYGDATADLKGAYDVDGWIEQSALLVTLQCNVTSASAVVTGGYAIVVHIDTPESELSNYELQTVDGTYTVSPRHITVKLPDFTRVYNGNEISLDDLGAATVTSGRLVNNDVLADLITFGFASTGANAGSYVITGSASEQSGNYTITVVDGTYTVTKLDLSNSASANFGISGAETLENGKLNAQLTGEELVLQGFVVLNGVTEPLATKPIAAITAPGEYTVTVEIDEVNYSGSRTFTVVVTDENGMTEELVQLLAQLKSLTEGKSVQDLTVDDFDQLKQIKGLLQQIEPLLQDLSSESLANVMDEIEVGYTLTDGWNAIANGDDRTVQTAVTIADAALGGLFVTLGTLQALAAVAFATRKGGLL